jgi:hypothetical protein
VLDGPAVLAVAAVAVVAVAAVVAVVSVVDVVLVEVLDGLEALAVVPEVEEAFDEWPVVAARHAVSATMAVALSAPVRRRARRAGCGRRRRAAGRAGVEVFMARWCGRFLRATSGVPRCSP